MVEYFIVGDIAGNFKTLMALREKCPDGQLISVGDMIDRGPRSKEVLDFFMNNGGMAVMGNHEHMMIDFCRVSKIYDRGIWMMNGGAFTIKSFFPTMDMASTKEVLEKLWPYLPFLESLPEAIRTTSGLYVSHAPHAAHINDSFDAIWNRGKAEPLPNYFAVHGHNPVEKPMFYSKDNESEPYAVNIDTSRAGVLTGITWPGKQIFQQEYID